MNSKSEKERTKQIHEKCQRLLNDMLKDDDNKYCVDCDAKGPRWASWNIGIFLCIRCAGIHRKLGVHISRVKSVNLDTWTPQQVVSLQQMGNSKARAVYEANLPDNFRRPQSDSSLETFIRAKYEQKKYVAREWVPPPLPKVNWDKELEEEAEKLRRKKREGMHSNLSSVRAINTPLTIPQPLPKPQTSSPKLSNSSKQNTTDLLGLNTPTKENSNNDFSNSELFTNFLDASSSEVSNNMVASAVQQESTTTTVTSKSEEEDFFNQSISSTSNKQKQLTKDSILALYGNPTKNFGNGPIATNSNNIFSVPSLNGLANSFPRPTTTSQPTFKNDQIQANSSFLNNAVSSCDNVAFAANPFYTMAASGVHPNFSTQKDLTNLVPTSSVIGLNLQQNPLNQQLEGLSLNDKLSKFSFPPINDDSANKINHQSTGAVDRSVTATNFWE